MSLDVDEVQGNILHAYGTDCSHACYRFLRVDEHRAAEAAGAIGQWIGEVTFGKGRDPGERGVHVNLAFTYAGLQALGVPGTVLDEFPADFRSGAVRRSAHHVGDRGCNAPDHWEEPFGTAHVLLAVHGRTADRCVQFAGKLLDVAAGAMTPVGAVQTAGLLGRERPRQHTCGVEFSREHFGFADGCSQPAIEYVNENKGSDGVMARVPRRGAVTQVLEDVGVLATRRRHRLLRAGEFILGYDDEDGRPPAGPRAPLGPNGTFMVYRKLAQDVRAFNEHIEASAQALGIAPELLKAKIIGRDEDGVPLERHAPAAATHAVAANAFGYADDPWGTECPVGAHVRRTNPRDALPGGPEVTMRHRMIRRGMPYGPPWTPATDDEERGLIFICYTASIEQGFEFVQRTWCYEGQVFGLGDQPDYILQQPDDGGRLSGRMWISGIGALEPPPVPLVAVRGCEYLFVPSRRACEWIAARHTASA